MILRGSGYEPTNKGHKKVGRTREFCRYSVYESKTDNPIIIDGTAVQCAKVLGMTQNSFYSFVSKCRKGKVRKKAVYCMHVDDCDVEEV